ncbi:MAG TPA: SDR family NAD(P)-dependent oxidoreductase [Actinocrinis sp.]|nr:SDR family NAD(P)-dependent oxidoreductase [Actinocrinis sp.]
MADTGRTTRQDLDGIGRIAAAVPGAADAAAVLDRTIRHRPAADPAAAPTTGTRSPGAPIPRDRPALTEGPAPRPPLAAPARTLTEALLAAAAAGPGRGTTYLLPDGSTDRQTYAQLLDEALRVRTGLGRLGLGPGGPVLLQCADSRSFVTAFWGCVLGGHVPTAVGPAPEYRAENSVTRKLNAAWELLGHPPIVADAELHDQVADLGRYWQGDLRTALLPELLAAPPGDPFPAGPDDPAVNLLTSGSTGTPKCVQHKHRTLVARTHAAIEANGFTEDEVSFNWMPLDHVGGMVMFNVRDVFLQCEHVNARPESMLRRPLNWLDWVDRFRATNTWAPNFAFALVNKLDDAIKAGTWDLSNLRNICNAGEAVVARTAYRFLELLTAHGLPADAMVPCWGMSETSSGVTYSRLDLHDRTVGAVAVDSASLDGDLVQVDPGAPGSVLLTEVGRPVSGVRLRIVDEQGALSTEGRVGHLHVAGSTVMAGYLHNEAANAAGFTADGWFDTGDLGFLRDGRLTLTGRGKHMVIVNGANYPAHEVEAVVEQVSGVVPACAAVCGLHDEDTGTDAILVFFVWSAHSPDDVVGTVSAIRTALARDLALRPKWIVPVTEAEFPRAMGGKVQRERLLEALQAGRFDDRLFGGGPDVTRQADDGWLLEQVWSRVETEPAQAEPAGADEVVLVYARPGAEWPERIPGGVAVLSHGTHFQDLGSGRIQADLLDPEQHDRALTRLTATYGRPTWIGYAVETGPPVDPQQAPARLLATLGALHRVLPKAELVVLTQGAVGVLSDDDLIPGRAALTGLVRTAGAEGVLASVRLVDAPTTATGDELAGLLGGRWQDRLVGIRGAAGYAARLRVLESPGRFDLPAPVLRPGGTALVNGGLGGLGRAVAEHLLVAAGARLLIVGRTPEADLAGSGRDEVLAGLRRLGDVEYRAIDVADASALAEAVGSAEHRWAGTLQSVWHLAGASVTPQWADLSAHDLTRETAAWLDRMLAPKLKGAAAVDALLADRPGTSAVVFSSVNGFLGGSGFGAYSAANAAVDAYCHRWAARGHEVHCLAWSMWSGPGMNDGSPLTAAARRRGLRLIDPDEGVALMLAALHHQAPYLMIGVDPGNPYLKPYLAADQFTEGRIVVAVEPEPSADPAAVRREVAAALAREGVFARVVTVPRIIRDRAGAPDPVAVLAAGTQPAAGFSAPSGPAESLVADAVREVLGVPRVGRDESFFSLGCDSIRVVRIAGTLTERLGRAVAVATLYERPTVRELAEVIVGAAQD